MKHSFCSEYENVVISPLLEEHIEKLRVWRNNPANSTFLRKLPYITTDMQCAWYESYLGNEDEIAFAIYETKELNRMVGSLSLLHFENNRVECGHIMVGDTEAHGRHVCENAMKAIERIAFDILKQNEMYLFVACKNELAVHVYQNAGFRIVDCGGTCPKDEFCMVLKARECM